MIYIIMNYKSHKHLNSCYLIIIILNNYGLIIWTYLCISKDINHNWLDRYDRDKWVIE